MRWLVEVGQWIERGQPLVEVETDKSIMELESAVTGTLQAVAVPAGGEAAAGQVIATFVVEDAQAWRRRAGRSRGSCRTARSQRPAEIGVSGEMVASIRPASQPLASDARGAQFRSSPAIGKPATTCCRPVPRRQPTAADFLRELYERMVLIREFEDGVKFLFLEGTMPGTIHQCQGQEATAVGVCAALERDDFITSTFRGHGHALAKGLTPEELLFELFGAATGCCRGKGGSMHVGNMDKGMVPGIAIVGGGVPLAAGMALAFKMQKSSQVVACFFGDGAVAEGAFHEGVNLAAIWDLAGRVRLREQPVRRVDTGRPRDAQPANRRPRGRLRHSGRARRRQRRAGRLRGGPVGRRGLPARPRAGVARAADLSPHRPLPPRRLPLPAQGRTRGVVCPRSDRSTGPAA